jgi:hypothetical protein
LRYAYGNYTEGAADETLGRDYIIDDHLEITAGEGVLDVQASLPYVDRREVLDVVVVVERI